MKLEDPLLSKCHVYHIIQDIIQDFSKSDISLIFFG